MCDSCGWRSVKNQLSRLMLKPEYRDDIDLIYAINNRITEHVSPDDLNEINSIMTNAKTRSVASVRIGTKDTFDPRMIIERNMELVDNYKYVSGDGYYSWSDNGVWSREHDDEIESLMAQYIPKNKSSYLNEMIRFFKISCKMEKGKDMNYDRYKMNLSNCMLDLKNMDVIPHNKYLYSTVQINITYNPEATCPNWEKFISEVVETPEEGMILQEYTGYCLMPEAKHEKALILIGTGSNGKSTFLNVIRSIIGEQNISSISMDGLTNQFSRMVLYNKLVNIATELEAGEVAATDYLKKIISGEVIDACYKFRDIMNFKPFCKLIFAMNNLPHFKDKSHGLYRKLILIDFPKEFPKNVDYENSLMVEKEGILNWALEGLRRLVENRSFTYSDKAMSEISKYKRNNNSLASFVEENVEFAEDEYDAQLNYISKADFYLRYKNWCMDNGLKAASSITMYKDLKNLNKKIVSDGQLRVEHKRTMVIFGVKWKE